MNEKTEAQKGKGQCQFHIEFISEAETRDSLSQDEEWEVGDCITRV